jgi:phage shock protein C
MSAPPLTPPAASRRLFRSRHHRMIAGVCGGIAEYLEVDPTVIRVLYVIVSILTGIVPGILAYIILMFVVPRADAPA